MWKKLRKLEIKGFAVGIMVMALLMPLLVTGDAQTVTRQITYGVRINLNGQLLQFDHDMRPFVMEERTYLSVRAIAEALDLPVDFNPDTNTVYLGERPAEREIPMRTGTSSTDPFEVLRNVTERFGAEVTNNNPIIPGGVLRWGVGTSSLIPGVWCPVHWFASLDGDVRMLFTEPLLVAGMDMNVSNTGSLATAYFDRDAQTITIVKNHASYWHDGVPVTLDDLLFAYEVIAHPDYQGPRWGWNISNIVGAVEYRDGEVDYISGLVLSEDKMTLTKHLIDFPPTIPAMQFWHTPMPRHHWEGIAVADMMDHPNARHNVLGNGPFIIEEFVPGEAIHFVRNDNFWRGRPHLDGIIMEVVDPFILPMAVQLGIFDIASPFPQAQFTEEFRYMNNTQFLSNPFAPNVSWWLMFRMGSFDYNIGRSVPWDEPRLSRTVRTAIALSIDHMTAAELYNGLVIPTSSIYFPLRRTDWINTAIPTHNNFDPERAMQMLDEAGYVDQTGDGWRDRPDGSPLVIIYLAHIGSTAAEANRTLELQNWHDIGLNVQLYQGRLVEFMEATDVRIHETDGGIVDMWLSGWSLGVNPNPRTIFGYDTNINFTRWVSDEWTEIFDRFDSDDMWNPDFRAQVVDDWQWAVYDAAVMFPTTVTIGLTAVNNRVANFSLEITGDMSVVSYRNPWLWALTAEELYVDARD